MIIKTAFQSAIVPIWLIYIVVGIFIFLMGITLSLLIVRAVLLFPPIRHLAQSIYQIISSRD